MNICYILHVKEHFLQSTIVMGFFPVQVMPYFYANNHQISYKIAIFYNASFFFFFWHSIQIVLHFMLDNHWPITVIFLIEPFFANFCIFSGFILPPKSMHPSLLILWLFSEHPEGHTAENEGPRINHCFPGVASHTKSKQFS